MLVQTSIPTRAASLLSAPGKSNWLIGALLIGACPTLSAPARSRQLRLFSWRWEGVGSDDDAPGRVASLSNCDTVANCITTLRSLIVIIVMQLPMAVSKL